MTKLIISSLILALLLTNCVRSKSTNVKSTDNINLTTPTPNKNISLSIENNPLIYKEETENGKVSVPDNSNYLLGLLSILSFIIFKKVKDV